VHNKKLQREEAHPKKTHDFSMFYLLQVAETHREENVVKE
jgi:hypothetical protein